MDHLITPGRQHVEPGLRELQTAKGTKDRGLAELADLRHNYSGEVERGEKAVAIDVLMKLSQALRVRLCTLVAQL
jgi:transcriptional regulator with XRE-family HTH domain